MPVDDLRRSPMMSHLLDALERGEDIGHYGRLVVAIVARYFVDQDQLVKLLTQGGHVSHREARALIEQVKERHYTPPSRAKILEWQEEQAFPLCPTPADPDACNLYQELEFPDKVYENIDAYHDRQTRGGEVTRRP
jgi:hypothetical protein